MELSNQILSKITVHMKYARYLEKEQRRETWDELVTRNMNMHLKKFPELELQIVKAYKMVFDRKVLPSMRSMQFGGKPIEVAPNRIFNCALMPGAALERLCFSFSAAPVLVILCKNTTQRNYRRLPNQT